MVDEGRSGGSYGGGTMPWEDRSSQAVGTIVATAVAAGVIAFLLRRSREEQAPQAKMAGMARGWADSDNLDAGREFFMGRILPELKPALLAILDEIEEAVDEGFRRAEKNIKKL
jgi:hypothetical protein